MNSGAAIVDLSDVVVVLRVAFVALFLAVLLFPGVVGYLLNGLGFRAVGFWLLRKAIARSKKSNDTPGRAIDFARATDLSVRRGLTGVARERLLLEAEDNFRRSAFVSGLARAWLGRVELLQGRCDEAERDLRLSLAAKDSAFARFELARLAIARRAFADAAELIAVVPWWKSLAADFMFLRSIVCAHAKEYDEANRWLFWARRSKAVRARADVVRALICAGEADSAGFSRSLIASFKKGVAKGAACLGLARLSRLRGEVVSCRAWTLAGLEHEPDNVLLRMEDALRVEVPLATLVESASASVESAWTARELFRYAARRRERSVVLDRMLHEGVAGDVEEAAGDYAYGTGAFADAVRFWIRAGSRTEKGRDVARERARVVAEECLASGRADMASRIVSVARLESPFRDEVGRRAAYAFLEGASAGRRFEVPEKFDAAAPPRVRALIRLITESVAAARSELDTVVRKSADPIGELLAGRAGIPSDAGKWREAAEARRQSLATGLAAFRSAIAERNWKSAETWLAGFAWRFGNLRAEIAATEQLLEIISGGERRERDVEKIAASCSSERIRMLARHDVAVEIEREREAGGRGWSGWRRWAAAWDEALSQKVYAAFVSGRAIDLDDPRVGRDAATEAIDRAEARLAVTLRTWLDGETKRRSIADEVLRSRLFRRTAEVIASELCATVDHASSNIETDSTANAERRAKRSDAMWLSLRSMVDSLSQCHAQLENLGVLNERATGLAERSSRTLINLSVDLNAVREYANAIHVSEAALKLARAPADIELCEKNLSVYRANAMKR
ncbi:MAG: hypothetical protein HYY84_10155 [Deltaproteobacteria bacterium]|nr:hypothetical protein [Deltaproteobacteria bacterium]